MGQGTDMMERGEGENEAGWQSATVPRFDLIRLFDLVKDILRTQSSLAALKMTIAEVRIASGSSTWHQ